MALHGGAECVSQARALVREAVAALPGLAGREDDVGLAVSEAVTNAYVHGHREHPGTIVLRVGVRAGRVEVAITDRGVGMAPRTDSPGLGLGLSIIAAISDDVQTQAVPGGGTTMRLGFLLS